jgi:hypothetical protein
MGHQTSRQKGTGAALQYLMHSRILCVQVGLSSRMRTNFQCKTTYDQYHGMKKHTWYNPLHLVIDMHQHHQ